MKTETGVNITHDKLVDIASKWLKKTIKCRVVISELVAYTQYGEVPDAIGWKSGRSILIECKTSRSDFLADKLKNFRRNPDLGLGDFRFFLCPDGLILPSELPIGWGLLYHSPDRKGIRRVVSFKGNTLSDNGQFRIHLKDARGEIALLLSYISRGEK
jgi:hypothetical protein